MSKIILLDLDGVVIRPRHKYFSEKFSEEYGVPIDKITPFFKNEYKKSTRGEVGIKDILPDYLSKWGWKKSLDDFLSYWFNGEKETDEYVIDQVRKLRARGVKVYLVSDNERDRAGFVMNELSLKDKFDGAFFSCDLGFTKSEPDFFKKVINTLKVVPGDIEYFDDDAKNTEVARKLGISSKVYTSWKDLRKDL